MIAIIDYGVGNLKSVQNALKFLGAEAIIVTKPSELKNLDAIILPGVGAFDDTISGLEPFKDYILNFKKPILGICIGMQILFEESEEGTLNGLGILNGKVMKLPAKKLPQIGWNQIQIKKNSELLKNIPLNSYVYFINSYAPEFSEYETASCEYGRKFPAAIEKKNIFATLFHPEKSGEVGLQILRNFLKISGEMK